MRDYFELATTVPTDEPCAQVGSDNYTSTARAEAEAFRQQIYRTFGDPPVGTGIKIISCPHDFGSYLDLQIVYDCDSEESSDWAFGVEGGLPDNWDAEAIEEQKSKGYKLNS